jgi:hypothetical protein
MLNKNSFNTGGTTAPAPREQAGAFDIPSTVPHTRLTSGTGTEPTRRLQARVGAEQTPIQAHNTTKRAVAGTSSPTNPAVNPVTRRSSLVASRSNARGLTGNNSQSRLGSGTPSPKPKSVAGMPEVYNVGGEGGHSSVLVKIQHHGNTQAKHTARVVALRVRNGVVAGKDTTKQPLTQPKGTKIYAGFHHVGTVR